MISELEYGLDPHELISLADRYHFEARRLKEPRRDGRLYRPNADELQRTLAWMDSTHEAIRGLARGNPAFPGTPLEFNLYHGLLSAYNSSRAIVETAYQSNGGG